MDAETKREFDRLHRELKALKMEQEKKTWVSPSWISDLTGWSKEKLRMAREQKIVEVKRSNSGGWLYRLESIPQHFIKQKITS
jgi:hypothetical protein